MVAVQAFSSLVMWCSRRGRPPGHDGTPRGGLLDDDLAPFRELEDGQERHRHDPIVDAAEEVLEHEESARGGPRG